MISLFLNGLGIEIDVKNAGEKEEEIVVYIYDCLSDLKISERDAVLNYLRAEGFIKNKIRCEVIRGEDYL